jgi:hypothetical protein
MAINATRIFLRCFGSGISLVFVLAMVHACATSPSPTTVDPAADRPREYASLRPLLADLDQRHRHLESLHHELHLLAEHMMYQSTGQLDYLQKLALFVQSARMIALSQYQLLSLVNYIDPDHLQDYYVLRVKGLKWALSETQHWINLIRVYEAFVEHPEGQRLAAESLDFLQGTLKLYDRIRAQLEGLVLTTQTQV